MPAYVEMSPVSLADRGAAERARQIASDLGLGHLVAIETDKEGHCTVSVGYTLTFKSAPSDLLEFLDVLARERLVSGPQIVRIFAESDELSIGAVLVPGHGAVEVDHDAIWTLPANMVMIGEDRPPGTLARARVRILTDGYFAVYEDAVPAELLETLGLVRGTPRP